MRRDGIIEDYAIEKLLIYEKYLEIYLSILISSKVFKQINVIDLFAGPGYSENGIAGSAIRAVNIIRGLEPTNNVTNIALKLNDKNQGYCSKLKDFTKDDDFVDITCGMADDFVENYRFEASSKSFFFIDPWGFTQLNDLNREKLFTSRSAEILMFVPLHDIRRFIKENKIFLNRLNIDISNPELNVNDPHCFSKLIKDGFSKITSKCNAEHNFILRKALQKNRSAIWYYLYFITKHPLGADKFLEIRKKLEDDMIDNDSRHLFGASPADNITKFMDVNKDYSNTELFYIGLKNEIHSTDIKRELEKLEGNGKIKVTPIPSIEKQQRRRAYYISYKHYKNKNKKVNILLLSK